MECERLQRAGNSKAGGLTGVQIESMREGLHVPVLNETHLI